MTKKLPLLLLMALALVLGAVLPATADPGNTSRVSVASDGTQANETSFFPSISRDGWIVAFASRATNLVPDDNNVQEDIFLHDRHTGVTELVNVDDDGNQANAISGFWWGIAVSSDWRYVAYASEATNLVSGGTISGVRHVYVRDRLTGTTELVSVDDAGNHANGDSGGVAMSDDGRYVAFVSAASNLVPGDTNDCAAWGIPSCPDVFVHDRQTGINERVSVDSAGNEADGASSFLGFQGAISADGRYVVFDSVATNLVSGDTNGKGDIFVHDRQTGVTERVSVDSAGNEANSWSDLESVNGDGRYVAFFSDASNLVPDDTNTAWDIFVHDRDTDADGIFDEAGAIGTERVSVDSAGNQSNGDSLSPAISSDARYVSFSSAASNLVPGDTNGTEDIFVHDRQTGATDRVSVDSAGNEGNSHSGGSWVGLGFSNDGRYVAFDSWASNLVAGDTNGYVDIFIRNWKPIVTDDNDGDGAADFADPCPANPDCDSDGSPDGSELSMGTLPLVACAATSDVNDERFGTWPADADDDQDADTGDVIILFKDVILNPPNYQPRSDFDADGDVDIGDTIAAFLGKILTTCA